LRLEDFSGAAAMPPDVAWLRLSAGLREADVREAVRAVSSLLGGGVPGRAGEILKTVKPTEPDAAHARSLSRRHGKSALPLHVETSHRPRPCRYVVLGCVKPGEASTPTTLLDRKDLGFSASETAELMGAPMLVRSGRRSFYSTILPRDCAYLRYDRDCMEAVCDRGRRALDIVGNGLARRNPYGHEWSTGDILVVDNWQALHGRGDATASASRHLVRTMVYA